MTKSWESEEIFVVCLYLSSLEHFSFRFSHCTAVSCCEQEKGCSYFNSYAPSCTFMLGLTIIWHAFFEYYVCGVIMWRCEISWRNVDWYGALSKEIAVIKITCLRMSPEGHWNHKVYNTMHTNNNANTLHCTYVVHFKSYMQEILKK